MNLRYRALYQGGDRLIKGCSYPKRSMVKPMRDGPPKFLGIETIVPEPRGDRPAVRVFFEPAT